MAEVKIEASWKEKLKAEFSKEYFETLIAFVRHEYSTTVVYPPGNKIFAAFDHSPFEATKVVILGQDPYHGAGEANGLCFSVADGVRVPPSLVNIYKEIQDDLGIPLPKSGNLERWAKQGVLLLNATLTVKANTAGSHRKKGWEKFMDVVVKLLSDEKENLVFLLWGSDAHEKGKNIDTSKHLVLKAKHPSPLAAKYGGWFGTKHFSQTNAYLKEKGLPEIEW
ncbi:MAG: uracil-DNA glycosylase [Verrucomicrobia bacterium]|nr:uracil-DNA glycosylase [Cytophagales bacterium]